MIAKLYTGKLATDVAIFTESIYCDGRNYAVAISMGDVQDSQKLNLRIHSHCLSSHVFLYTGCDCRGQMLRSQQRLLSEGSGVIIWLDQEGRSNGHLAKMIADSFKERGLSQSEAYLAAGYPADSRDYSMAVSIVRDLHPQSIHLLTSNPEKIAALCALGIPVVAEAV